MCIHRIIFVAVIASAWLVANGPPTCCLAGERPNILLILADDLGYGDVGCYNPHSKIPTPHLDRLASEGLRFTDAHSPSTVCTPSRYSLLTGRMCFRTGLRGVFTGVDGPLIEPERLTIGKLLQQHGYATACVGKWHVGMTFRTQDGSAVAPRGGGLEKVREVDFTQPILDGPNQCGFDYFFGTACCPTTDWLYAYIENDRFVTAPTELVQPRTSHWLEYEHFRTGLKAPDFEFDQVDQVFLKKSIAFLEQHARERTDQPFFLYHATQTAHLPAMPAPTFVGKTDVGPLGDFIFQFDHIVGELLQTLERLQLADNTLVIVSSDNGPEIVVTELRERYGHDSAGSWRGLKRDNWEGGHRVPLLVRWPAQTPQGAVSDQTICLTDMLTTFAAIVDHRLPIDAGEDSVNMLPALRHAQLDQPLRRDTVHQTISNMLAIRRGPWKLLDHKGSGGNSYDAARLQPYFVPDTAPDAPGQLYNLELDPGEKRNVYPDHPELVGELTRRLQEIRESGRSTPLHAPSADDR